MKGARPEARLVPVVAADVPYGSTFRPARVGASESQPHESQDGAQRSSGALCPTHRATANRLEPRNDSPVSCATNPRNTSGIRNRGSATSGLKSPGQAPVQQATSDPHWRPRHLPGRAFVRHARSLAQREAGGCRLAFIHPLWSANVRARQHLQRSAPRKRRTAGGLGNGGTRQGTAHPL